MMRIGCFSMCMGWLIPWGRLRQAGFAARAWRGGEAETLVHTRRRQQRRPAHVTRNQTLD
jgi:hypothetical protein